MNDNLWKRNSSSATDPLPSRNQVIGLRITGFPYWSLTSSVVFISEAACGIFAHSFDSALSGREIGWMTDFLVTYGFSDVKVGVTASWGPSRLVIYRRWCAPGELGKAVGNAAMMGVYPPKPVPGKNWCECRSNPLHPWGTSDSERPSVPRTGRMWDYEAELLQKSVTS